MGRLRRKRVHHARRDVSRAARTRARKLDQDQIHTNLNDPAKREELENPTELDPEKPGLGAYYCISCDRHFPSDNDRDKHLSSKLHKRKAKRAQEDPYTPEEAYRAAGIGVDNKQKEIKSKDVAEKMKDVEA
ncbi:unnamed protein product [Sympodiomycopsis kandeliae]